MIFAEFVIFAVAGVVAAAVVVVDPFAAVVGVAVVAGVVAVAVVVVDSFAVVVVAAAVVAVVACFLFNSTALLLLFAALAVMVAVGGGDVAGQFSCNSANSNNYDNSNSASFVYCCSSLAITMTEHCQQ